MSDRAVTKHAGRGFGPTGTAVRPGDRVIRKGGTIANRGTVARVVTGVFSNGGVPMVTVDWDSGSRGRHTATQLEIVGRMR